MSLKKNKIMTTGDPFRPQDFDSYIGQRDLKDNLKIRIKAAKKTTRSLQPMLLYGPPGAGKTSLGSIIAKELGVEFVARIMPLTETALRQVIEAHSGVLLLDELHRATPKQQELLLPLLEDGYLQSPSGKRVYAYGLSIIGATTEREKLIDTLTDRFVIKPSFEEYSDEELAEITKRMASSAGVDLDLEECKILGRASGGIPRNARQLVLAAHDLLQATGSYSVEQVLKLCQVDENGLSVDHHRYLDILYRFEKAGLSTLSTTLRMNPSVVNELERLLVSKDLVRYSEKGRVLTAEGWKFCENRS